MRTVTETRRANLDVLLREHFAGSRAQMSIRLGISRSQISQLFSKYRNVGDAIARRLETVCGLPLGWMDVDHAQDADEAEVLDSFRQLRTADARRKAVNILKMLAS